MIALWIGLAGAAYFVGIYRGIKAGRKLGRTAAEKELAQLLENGAL